MNPSIVEAFEPLFYPRSIAVIGASAEPAKFGNIILSAIMEIGYEGKIYPVNNEGREINGLKAYKSMKEIPGKVDFAILTIPASTVTGALEECLLKEVKGAEILTSGFRETGTPEGKRMEDEIAQIAKRGIRILGPNCFGIYCPESGLTILPGQNFSRGTGPVGFLSQSGGLCADLGQIAKGLGIHFSKMVSYGNGCDVAACDLLEYFFADEKTRIIAGYLEGVEDGPRFLSILKNKKKKKPVILWKAGLTATGSRAVMSHTGSLSGSEGVWNSALKQAGVVQVGSAEELTDTIYAFLYLPSNAGPRVALMGGGGAIGVAASDSLDRLGLSVPPLAPPILQKLKASFPPVGNSLKNPVDLGNPMIPPSMLRKVMEAGGEDGGIDTLMVIQILFYILYQRRHRERMDDRPLSQFSFQPELLKACQEVREKYRKAIIMILPDIVTDGQMIDLEIEWRRERDAYQAAGFPVFKSLDRAARALRNFLSYQRDQGL
ncbi:MAG: CoA-binding protein [Thermodesulfobacteriota bacterium]